MVSTEQTINTMHDDMIHDAQLDYYSRKLATASSDRTVRLFDVIETGQYQAIAELKGHTGAVWQVSWAHPKFGNLLASCSYDNKVIVWKENNGQWQMAWDSSSVSLHSSSVNSVAWCPHEYGLRLACGSADGNVSVVTYNPEDSTWVKSYVSQDTHGEGVNAVSWGPYQEQANPRLATAGCDNKAKIWELIEGVWIAIGELKREGSKSAHDDWVRDIAWAPSIGMPASVVATCGQDMKVYIWTLEGEEWKAHELGGKNHQFNDVVWRVSWSVTGNILAVTCGDKVTLWKEAVGNEWQLMQVVDTQ
ncbi:protein SEC13 [Sphaeroforma arctica JP610]|uniref:Protein SEC13 n=1 Tax=Sphaeroforma arctica JP610 TaxID=667725 RepID=A0A0L0FTK7_9EUKA|nr:protein SEC13 [Sphaeroforma arctica JP610]KNC80127.1 protein SEC13 [Sphaeroforma arctica JP610]|eukprot:XP_014154029.1 protein SEC13 [Sphaeroforma arctica JP610]